MVLLAQIPPPVEEAAHPLQPVVTLEQSEEEHGYLVHGDEPAAIQVADGAGQCLAEGSPVGCLAGGELDAERSSELEGPDARQQSFQRALNGLDQRWLSGGQGLGQLAHTGKLVRAGSEAQGEGS